MSEDKLTPELRAIFDRMYEEIMAESAAVSEQESQSDSQISENSSPNSQVSESTPQDSQVSEYEEDESDIEPRPTYRRVIPHQELDDNHHFIVPLVDKDQREWCKHPDYGLHMIHFWAVFVYNAWGENRILEWFTLYNPNREERFKLLVQAWFTMCCYPKKVVKTFDEFRDLYKEWKAEERTLRARFLEVVVPRCPECLSRNLPHEQDNLVWYYKKHFFERLVDFDALSEALHQHLRSVERLIMQRRVPASCVPIDTYNYYQKDAWRCLNEPTYFKFYQRIDDPYIRCKLVKIYREMYWYDLLVIKDERYKELLFKWEIPLMYTRNRPVHFTGNWVPHWD